jgi:hypothetical protein
MKFPELTYSSPTDPWPKRWTIRTIEHLAGRSYFVVLSPRSFSDGQHQRLTLSLD